MTLTTSQKGLCKFISVVNCHLDLWSRYSHMLEPLSNLMPNRAKFKCTYDEHEAFEEIKQIMDTYYRFQ